jgi:hypothetical protein
MKDRAWNQLNHNEKYSLLVIKQKDDQLRNAEAQRQAAILAAMHEQNLPAAPELGGIMQQYAREYEPGRLEFPKEMDAASSAAKKK